MDIWSAGLTFAIMVFRRMIIEGAENDSIQLLKVAEFVGGQKIIQYAESLRIKLDNETLRELSKINGSMWKNVRSKADPALCPDEAIDLLNKMLIVDHRERITAKKALKHPFFRSLNSS